MFDYSEKSKNDRDTSPRKVACTDDTWMKYESQTQDEKGCLALRKDTQFLDKLLNLLQTNTGEIIKNKEKRITFQYGLKVLSLIMMKTKMDDDEKMDIVKNIMIPNLLTNQLK